jgi:hypothetical protein
MEEGNGLFACGLDELIGSDDWPEEPGAGAMEDAVAEPLIAAAPSGGCRIHFNLRGPGNLRNMPMTTVMSSDGFDMDVDRLYTWAPAPNQAGGLSPAEVEASVSKIFRDSKSWMAAGIALRRVPFEEAQCIVKFVPDGQTVCGPGNAGCCSGPDSRRLIEMVVSVFGKHKGLMHELIHAFGHGRHNTIEICPSVMGGPPGIWPTPSDISSTRKWAHS